LGSTDPTAGEKRRIAALLSKLSGVTAACAVTAVTTLSDRLESVCHAAYVLTLF
jgi:hypothetical protein